MNLAAQKTGAAGAAVAALAAVGQIQRGIKCGIEQRLTGRSAKLHIRIEYADAHTRPCRVAVPFRPRADCACYPATRRSAPIVSNPARRDIPAARARPCPSRTPLHSSALRADAP